MTSIPLALYLLVAVTPVIRLVSGGSHAVPTFLHRYDENGEMVNAQNLAAFNVHKNRTFAGKHVTTFRSGQLNVSVDSIVSGDNITVSWLDIATPAVSDWIGVYCPGSSTESDYLDYVWANSSSTWKAGSGTFTSKLFNMRDDYEFRYYQTIHGKYHAAAVSPRVAVKEHEPCGGRLALGNELDTMVLAWTTDTDKDILVQYSLGMSFDEFTEVPAGEISARTYSAKDMCGAPATKVSATTFRDPGFQIFANMRNLTLNTTYHYQFGIRGSQLQSGYFRTPMAPGVAKSARFITFGDFGVHYHPQNWDQPGAPLVGEMLAEAVQTSRVDAVVHFGDLSYAVGHGYIWDQWNWLIAKSARFVPYMVGVGNHEYDHTGKPPGETDVSGTPGIGFHPTWGNLGDDSEGECGVPTYYRFKMPSEHNSGNSVFWYSFDLHLVRLIMMSSEHDYSPGTVQYKWLEGVLASTDREALPWVIITLHRPMYANTTDAKGDNIVANNMRALFEDLLVKYRVNVMFSGHYHCYMRSCPVINGECQAPGTAPVHIVAGSAGASLQHSAKFPAEWTVFSGLKFGYVVFEANHTNLHAEWITQDIGQSDKQVTDSVDVPLWKD